jgi:hypothetical protein
MGRKLLGTSVGLSYFGIADNNARNNSELVSFSNIQRFNKLQIHYATIGFYNNNFSVAISKPKTPGEAVLFIRLTVCASSLTVSGLFTLSIAS